MNPAPSLQLDPGGTVVLAGEWTLAALLPRLAEIEAQLADAASRARAWNLLALTRLDSAAAVLLWRTWRHAWPPALAIGEGLRPTLERVAALPEAPAPPPPGSVSPVEALGIPVLRFLRHLHGLVALFGQLLLDTAHLARHPREIPWREFSANVFKGGAQALPVAALVGFLIGITVGYLSALQLKVFGADLFIVNILGIAVIRELGPVLAAILVAGRSGSAMTAQIGVMRVTEEIDALATLGVSHSLRLVLPKVAALSLALPLLVVPTSAMGLAGGMLAAYWQLDLSPVYFFASLPQAVPLANVWIGLAKGACFGFAIALVACHFGLRVRPNTESLSARTTASVVTAITAVIVVDAVFALLTRQVGIPRL